MNTAKKRAYGRRRWIKRVNTQIAAILLSLSLTACSGAPLASAVRPAGTAYPTVAENKAPAEPSETKESPVSGDAASITIESTGFDSPEDAAAAYLDGLRDADFNRMISAFAIESFVENYDFKAMLNRLKAYVPASEIKLPNANEFVKALNIESRRGRVANAILQQYASLCKLELDPTQAEMLNDEAQVEDFDAKLNERLNAPKTQTLKIIGFIPPESLSELYSSERNLAYFAQQAAIYGAEQIVSRAVVFELDGNNFLLCFDSVEYGGKWYISQFGGNIGAMIGILSYNMGLVPLPAGDYDELNELIIPYEM